jgi:hypothetical protein
VEDAQAYRGSDGVLRSKYAVLTLEDFERLCDRRTLDGRVWARFSQPAALVFARDDETRERVQRAVAEAAVTLVGRILPLLAEEPHAGSAVQRFRAADLFSRGFRETYSAELRSEAPETIASVVESDPARYERVTREVLRVMVARGRLRSAERDGEDWVVLHDPGQVARGRRAWSLRRRVQKALVVVALLKTSLTQDDWVSYAVFKLERHSGREIPLTDRQRRHPLIFGWPVIVRLLRNGTLR